MSKIGKALLLTGVYILVLLLVYYLHMRYFRVDVVFYASVLDAFIAAAAVAGGCFALRVFRSWSRLEILQLLAIWMLGGYIFAISLPTVIDRSLSFYILEKIQQRGGGIREDAFKQVFTEEYVSEHRLVDVRLTEQLQSGTIEIVDGCVRLTARGDRLARFSRFYRRNLLPTHRLLMGEYVDDLTDPFRNSEQVMGYECR
ncbi:hypothetical protein [Luteimonas sp. FCS-9]|uniref:hypothetical protein n=1 Tax=Luteimonas sp. FCS-9 TaxID=1547516 RepID=UPI00063EA475|nr:hypothetical protein [Luteimonas sp. FCS-9]KLI98613.1 hypothetical protein WQ56_14835 [Luteimonas sp. FCS-9]